MEVNDSKKKILSLSSWQKTPESDARIKKRRQHNADLIQRMRQGESLRQFDKDMSWFPPRPIIEKDKNAIKTLYDLNKNDAVSESKATPLKPLDDVS